MPRKILASSALAAASVLVLAGCATTTTPSSGSSASASGGDALSVVASTSVYGQIVEAIGGDAVDVTSIVSSSSQDPHSYEASAQDQLTIQRADLIIENGGGYDSFVDALIEASGSTAPVVTAVEYSHDWPDNDGHDDDAEDAATASPDVEDDHAEEHAEDDHDHADHGHVEGFNEHVWYDPHTIVHVAEAIADELGELRPADADTFAANLAEFSTGIEGLEAELAAIAAAHEGEEVFVTEPVPLYMTAAAGLANATPAAFSEAVEEGQDVAPATLLEAITIIDSGAVSVVIANAQTGGAETTQVIDQAKAAGLPVLEFAETLPADTSYIEWMHDNIAALAGALGA